MSRRRRHLDVPRAVAVVAAGAAALAAGLVWASDPPHWTGKEFTIDCTSQCHTLHQGQGSALNSAASNVTLCQSCHNPTGLASGRAINNQDKAVPGTGGTSHSFDVPAVNATYGAQLPQHLQMSLRVMDGNLVCSTCHDQHASDASLGGTSRVSDAKKITALGSTASVTSGGTFGGPNAFWYLVEAQAGDTFRWSKDNGTSWMAQGVPMSRGSAVVLANGVTVTFGAAGTFSTGEQWEFSGSWPFLRKGMDLGDNAAGEKFCRDCHRDWVMDHTAVGAPGTAMRSHPVGVALNANNRGHDRSAPLDGNGGIQGGAGADTNRSNDLKLDAQGRVQCLTCHGVHYADGNTVTEDGP